MVRSDHLLTVGEILQNEDEFYRQILDNFSASLRVSTPGIITRFDPEEQTVTVQPVLRERISDLNGNYKWEPLPLLLDVPICLPRGGGFVTTFPIKEGDECLVVFADMCIDAWFSNGGVQNQIDRRRHDLSDAFAILGTWSQPNRISNYSTDSMQLRTEDGTQMIDISSSGINLIGNIKKNGVPI